MRRALLVAITVGGIGLPLVGGTALAVAGDSDERARVSGSGFELEIDPELDARFGPRPVNAAQAAAIVSRQFAGARVVEAELDERGGGPIWEMKFLLGTGEREVDVDAVTGAVLGGGDDSADDRGDDDFDDD